MTAVSMLRNIADEMGYKNDQQLGNATGIGPAAVSKLRHGVNQSVKLHTLLRIAIATDIGIGTLAEWWAEDIDEDLGAARKQRIARVQESHAAFNSAFDAFAGCMQSTNEGNS